MTRTKLVAFLLLEIFVLVGCADKSSVIDTNISHPPGWNNIIPGKTSSTDALSEVKSILEVDQSTIFIDTQGYDYWHDHISWRFIKDSSDERGEIFIKNNSVRMIIIFPKNNRVNFGEVIKAYGEPEKVFAGSIPNQPMITWVLYPDMGIVFNHIYGYIENNEGARIQPLDDVLEAYYFSPDEFQSTFLESNFFTASVYNYERTAQDWQGFNKKLPVINHYK